MGSYDLSAEVAPGRDVGRWLFWLALSVAAAVAVADWLMGAEAASLITVAVCGGLAFVAARLRAERRRDAQRLALQYRVARILSEAESPASAGPALLATIGEPLGFEAGELWVTRGRDALAHVASWRAPGTPTARFGRVSDELALRRGIGLPGQALETGQPARMADMSADPSFARGSRDGLCGGVAFPVLATGGVVGVIELFETKVRELDDDLTALMGALGGAIGEFIEARRAGSAVREREAQLEAILRGVADGITAQAPDGRLLFANEAAVRTLGFGSREELLAAPLDEVVGRFEVFDEHGDPFPPERLPGRIALVGGEPAEALVRFRERTSGEDRWSVVKSTPLLDADGKVAMAINVIEDITAVKRAEARQRFLAQAAEVLSSSLDRDETLRAIASLVVPEVADWCAIELRGANGAVERVALGDPAAGAEDERRKVAVPLTSRGRSIGTITFASVRSGRRFDRHDRELAEELGRRCATALDNARLYSERAHIARTLQRSLLPAELPDIPGLETAARFRPTGEGNEVGGDFYDLFASGGSSWTAVMGDVCGKGPEAAAVTALARYTLRAAAMRERLPSRSLLLLNEALLRQHGDRRFCTVAYAQLEAIDSGTRIGFATGGHPLPLVLRRDGAVERLGLPGTLLGVVPDPDLCDSSVTLQAGDALVLYTDGVTDARGGAVSETALTTLVSACAGLPADVIAARVESAAVQAQDGAPSDDIAVLVLRVRP